MAEDRVRGEDLLRLGHIPSDVGQVVSDRAPEHLLHLVEMRAQVVHPERAGEVGLVASGEQLGHVPEVAQPVVDRCCGKHE